MTATKHLTAADFAGVRAVAREMVYAERKGDESAVSGMLALLQSLESAPLHDAAIREYNEVHAEMRSYDARDAHDRAKRALYAEDDTGYWAGDRQYDHPLTVMRKIEADVTLRKWDDAILALKAVR